MPLNSFISSTDGGNTLHSAVRRTKSGYYRRINWAKVLAENRGWKRFFKSWVWNDMGVRNKYSFTRGTGKQLSILKLQKIH